MYQITGYRIWSSFVGAIPCKENLKAIIMDLKWGVIMDSCSELGECCAVDTTEAISDSFDSDVDGDCVTYDVDDFPEEAILDLSETNEAEIESDDLSPALDDIPEDDFSENAIDALADISDDSDVDDSGETANEEMNDSEPDWERTSLTGEEEAIVQEMSDDGELDIPVVNEDLTDPVHAGLHLPSATGEFLGERGNSEFRPTGKEALKTMSEYGRESVEYKGGYPDFSPFTTHKSPWGDLDCQVEIGHMTDQRENPSWEFGERPRGSGHDPNYDLGNFAQADNSLLERLHETNPDATVQDVVVFRKDNNLTWHECADGKTMQLVPTVIHDACRHSGGVSEMKYRMAWGDVELPY